ncbi:glycosyltransferase [Alphaproteobacteria bacterium]|nr:glycosyltransferase [Alphaproteobacteria bacterium]
MNKTRITLITPIRNGATFLEKQLKSVLDQNCGIAEQLFIDGGSSDGSRELILRYQERFPSRIRFFDFPDDIKFSGSGGAWNFGALQARGDIIGWLGADDESSPGALDYAIDYFDKRKITNVIFGHCETIDEDGKALKILRAAPVTKSVLLSGVNNVPCPATFYRKKTFFDVGGVDDYGNDLDLFIKIADDNEIVPVDFLMARFRVHEKSETGNLTSYIGILGLDADVLTKHTGRYFSITRVRFLLAQTMQKLRLVKLVFLFRQIGSNLRSKK